MTSISEEEEDEEEGEEKRRGERKIKLQSFDSEAWIGSLFQAARGSAAKPSAKNFSFP